MISAIERATHAHRERREQKREELEEHLHASVDYFLSHGRCDDFDHGNLLPSVFGSYCIDTGCGMQGQQPGVKKEGRVKEIDTAIYYI